MKPAKKNRRDGYTLIETLVVIAILGVTLTIVALSMHALHRAEKRLRGELQDQLVIERLGAQLRTDAHQAIAVTTKNVAEDPQARVLTISLSKDDSIEYSLGTSGIERTVKRGSEVEHREHFHVAAAPGNSWIVDAARQHPLVALHLIHHRTNDASNAEHDVTVIQAAVGISRYNAQQD